MSAVPPELAAKVDAANLRNHVKAVGEGATLPPATRQVFMTFAAKGDPDAMRDARETALLQKWLSAGRLSKEERAEIEHILPSSSAPAVESIAPVPLKSNGYLRSADDYGHIGISRRKFFRWKSAGESAATGPDLPPFDDPLQLEAWYERHRSAGAFKHRFPKDVKRAILEFSASSPRAPAAPAEASSKPGVSKESAAPVPPSFLAQHFDDQGLQVEVKHESNRLAAIRVARDAAYARGDRDEGKLLANEYLDVLDKFSLISQRAMKEAIEKEFLVALDLIAKEWEPKLNAVVQQGFLLADEVEPQLAKLGPADRLQRRAILHEAWRGACRSLVEGKFTKPMRLEQHFA